MTNSTVVFGWLKKCPSVLRVYVSYRMAKIVPASHWHYVKILKMCCLEEYRPKSGLT